MKELDPTIPPDNIETIRAEAGDVLWYLVLLITEKKLPTSHYPIKQD